MLSKVFSIAVLHCYRLFLIVIVTNIAVYSYAQSSERKWKLGFTGKVKWSANCKFLGGDYDTRAAKLPAGKCEELCVADVHCTHFTSSYEAGCFLKSFKQPFVTEKNAGPNDFNSICGFSIHQKGVMIDGDQLDIDEVKFSKWRNGAGTGNYKWGPKCDFYGNDIEKLSMEDSANCGDSCFTNKRCTHFTHHRGVCYLKLIFDKAIKPVYKNDENICGFIVERKCTKNWQNSNDGRVNYGTHCDFPGHDIETIRMMPYENKFKCGEKCLTNKRCTHFTYASFTFWQNYCFLKEIPDKNSVVEIANEKTPVCGFVKREEIRLTTSSTNKMTSKRPIKEKMYQTTSKSLPSSFFAKNRQKAGLAKEKKQTPLSLLWNDEFSVGLNSSSNWKHVVGVSKTGFQYYTTHHENSFVRDGILNIKPTLTSDRFGYDFLEKGYFDLIEEGCDPKISKCIVSGTTSEDIINPIASARITTAESFNFTFGTVTIKAKMPKGDLITTGISLVPAGNVYGKGPLSGEIELLQVYGNAHMRCLNRHTNRQVVSSGLQWGPTDSAANATSAFSTYKLSEGVDFSTDFHIFSTEWSPEGFKFLVDGKLVGQLQVPEGGLWKYAIGDETKKDNPWVSGSPIAPFDQPFFISVGVDVGGTHFPDADCTYLPKRKPWFCSSPASMRQFWDDIEHWLPTWKANKGGNTLQIDYIRVYKHNEKV